MQQQFEALRAAGYHPVWTAPGKKHPSCPWKEGEYSRSKVGEYCGGGIGILTGYSGVLAIDFDVVRDASPYDHVSQDGKYMDGMSVYEAIEQQYLAGCKYMSTSTPTGGRHVIMRCPQGWAPAGAANVLTTDGPRGQPCKVSIDIRYVGGFLMCGPSPYPGDVHGNAPWKNDYRGQPYATDQIIPVDELDYVPEELVEVFKAGGFAIEDGVMVPKCFNKRPAAPKPAAPEREEVPARQEVTAPVKQTPRAARKLLEALADGRWQEYDSWVGIGFATYHTFPDCLDEALEIWDELSQDKDYEDKYVEGECARKWASFEREEWEPRKGAGTLVQMAMADKPDIMKTLARLGLLDNAQKGEEYVWFADYVKLVGREVKSGDVLAWWRNTVRFCVTADGGTYYLKTRDEITGSSSWRPMSCNAFQKTVLNNIHVDLGGDKRVCLKPLLKEQHAEITVRQVGFVPHAPGVEVLSKDVLNTFTRFKGSKIDVSAELAEKANFIFEHIRDVWAAGNEQHYAYIRGWLASIAQHPEKKNQTALVLKSALGGGGKTIAANFFAERVFGSDYATNYGSVAQLLDKFNIERETQVFAIVDETSSTDHKEADVIKDTITKSTQKIQGKGTKIREVPNYLNLVFMTNNDYALRIDPGDRRFAIFECSTQYIGDTEHFDKFAEYMNDQAVGDAVYTMLLEEDISDYNPRSQLPQTEAKFRLQMKGVKTCEDMLCRYLAGDLEHNPLREKDGIIEIPSEPLYEYYKDRYCPGQGISKPVTQKAFSGDAFKVLGQTKRKMICGKRRMGWIVTREELENKLISVLGEELFLELTR